MSVAPVPRRFSIDSNVNSVEAARDRGVAALVGAALRGQRSSPLWRHVPVPVDGDGWVTCSRCGVSWDELDDEARGKPLTCMPGVSR